MHRKEKGLLTEGNFQFYSSKLIHPDKQESQGIVRGLSKSTPRRLTYYLLVLLSGGLVFLFQHWFISLQEFCKFKRTPIPIATHVFLWTQHSSCILPLARTSGYLYFTFQHIRFYFDGSQFRPLIFEDGIQCKALIDQYSEGYSEVPYENIYGPCQILVPIPSIFSMIVSDFLHPFYIFQVCSVVIWLTDNYIYYAVAIMLTTLVSLATSLYTTRKNFIHIHKIAKFSCPINVFRGEWVEMNSTHLIPGDLVEIPSGILPCDLALISGTCISEEGMLTGEAVPVVKDPLPYEKTEIPKRSTLYEGTKVIQTRNSPRGVVLRTGFSTLKGSLIRSILFPRPNKFKFYRDSMIYISVLAVIAILGFILVLPIQISLGVPTRDIILRSLDLITVVVPPSLPAAMAAGTAFAILRLKKHGITCICAPRVNVSGNIDTLVFDKTGTLTEEGMEFLGIIPAMNNKCEKLYENPIGLANEQLLKCLGVCHSLVEVQGEIVGEPLEVQIFNSIACKMQVKEDESLTIKGHGKELEIVQTFHFSSVLKRMGCVSKDKSFYEFYTKGAPEVILERCLPEYIPEDTSSAIANYTSKGYRVLACAYKPLGFEYERATQIEMVEEGLRFLGLIILKNNLKPGSDKTIAKLNKARIGTVMATGDALLTGISIGRESGILRPTDEVFIGEFDSSLKWSSSESPFEYFVDIPMDDKVLAVTGEAFEHLRRTDALPNILAQCKIYARMSPEHKTNLVESLQESGRLVGMCGDGANDCGALKAADIGVSLSEAETSVAAPFTSKTAHISCMETTLKEGRCALATSTQLFKFIALYSMTQFVSVCILYSAGSNINDLQFLVIDLFTILTLVGTMSYTKPYSRLSKRTPTSNLISFQVLSSVIGQVLIVALFQVGAYSLLRQMDFFERNEYVSGGNVDQFNYCYENTVVFLVSWYQYLSICLVYSIGKPWKMPAYTNYYLTVNLALLGLLCIYSIVWPLGIDSLLKLKDLPLWFRFIILACCAIYSAISYAWEKYITFKAPNLRRKRSFIELTSK